MTGAETAIDWWRKRGEDPKEKLIIFSDGLDADKIVVLEQGRIAAEGTHAGGGPASSALHPSPPNAPPATMHVNATTSEPTMPTTQTISQSVVVCEARPSMP